MKLLTIADHTIDVERLHRNQNPRVLDIGSRGQMFAKGIWELNPLAYVLQIDPDSNVIDCVHVAIVGRGEVRQTYVRYSTGEGNFLGSPFGIAGADPIEIPCMTVDGFSRAAGIKFWDVIKLDCEGSEFGILETWPGKICDQISVEFHDYKNPKLYNHYYFQWLFEQMKEKGYVVARHEWIKQGDTWGHWDSLLVLK